MKDRPEVLFLCVHNAGRSQMAAAFARQLGQGRISVFTAGSAPASEINPQVIEAMREVGLDLSEEFPKPIADEVVRAADVVITMGCGDACPIYPGQEIRRLGARRSGRPATQEGANDSRRDLDASRKALG